MNYINWITKDGTVLPLSEMTDAHLANVLVAVRERRVGNPYAHNCWVVDIMDGPCPECEDEGDWDRGWVCALEAEIKRRGKLGSDN